MNFHLRQETETSCMVVHPISTSRDKHLNIIVSRMWFYLDNRPFGILTENAH